MQRNKKRWKPYVFWIALAEGTGLLSGWLTRAGMMRYEQTAVLPPLSPPSWVFPVVWAILYALMGIGAARVYLSRPSAARSRALLMFVVQLAVNFFWSILFFNFQLYGLAFLWLVLLWALVLMMSVLFARVDRPAGWLQLPYLLWLTFAAWLNFSAWLLNR